VLILGGGVGKCQKKGGGRGTEVGKGEKEGGKGEGRGRGARVGKERERGGKGGGEEE
jgi:hypothetical protein